MKFDELFEHRSLVASKLKDCIRDKGHTKVAFAAKANILLPTLDKLLNGSINSKSSFNRHLQKILMSIEDLMLYHSTPAKATLIKGYSQSTLLNQGMNDTVKKQYNLFFDVLGLCSIYY